MLKIIEIIIISVIGVGAVCFFILYMINEVKGKNKCLGCAAFNYCEKSKKKSDKNINCKERAHKWNL